MNARGIPAQSEEQNLEKDYSYTLNEMTGEKIPFGQEPQYGPTQPPAPSGDTSAPQPAAASDQSGEGSKRTSTTKKSE